MSAARVTIHPAGERPARGIAQLVAVALSGVSKEVTREAEARMYKSRRLGIDIDAEVGGPGDERWMPWTPRLRAAELIITAWD